MRRRTLSTPALLTLSFTALSLVISNSALAQEADEDEVVVEEEEPDEGEVDAEEEAPDEATDEAADEASEDADSVPADEPEETESEATTEEDVSEEDVSAEEIQAEDETVEVEEVAAVDPGPAVDKKEADEAAQAALADAPEKGPSLSPIKFTTSTWSRFEMRENYDDLGVSRGRFQEGDFFVFRARLGMQTNPLAISDGSDVIVQFTPQASGMWGANGTIGEANLGIYEGYFKIRSERLDVQVGRMMMNYGDALVIGNLDWNQIGRAFDGVRAHYKLNKGYLDVFGTMISEAYPDEGSKFFGGDQMFWGAYAGFGDYISKGLALDAYFLALTNVRHDDFTDDTTGATYDIEGSNLFTVGARVKDRIGMFDYRAEAGFQFGRTQGVAPAGFTGTEVESVKTLAYQADGEVGLNFAGPTRISVGALIASGDDPSTTTNEGYNQLFPTGHKFLGLMDIAGDRVNIASGNLKVFRGLTDSLSAEVDAHLFARLEDGGLGSVGGPGLAGTEVDAQLIQALGKYAKVRGLYGIYIPISGQYASDDVAHYVEVQAGVDF